MASPKRSSTRKAKNLSPEEIENLLSDLEKYKKQEEAEKKKHEQQLRKDQQANKKKVTREVQMAAKEVRKKEMEVKKLQMGLAKVEQQEDQTLQKKARQNATIDEAVSRLRKKFADLEAQLVQKTEESGKAHGWLQHVEFAQNMLEQTGKLLECEVDPNFTLEEIEDQKKEALQPPEPPPEVVQEKIVLQKRTSRLQQENDRLRKEIEENRRIVQALEDSTNRFVAKRKAQAEENGAEDLPRATAVMVSESPKTRPVTLASAMSVGDLRSPSYPGPSILQVSYNRQGYSGYSYGTTYTTAVGYTGQSSAVPAALEPLSSGGYGGFGMVRPYSLPQLPTVGGALSSPVAQPSLKVRAREAGYNSPAGMGNPVSLGPSSESAAKETASPTPSPAAPPPVKDRHGGRFQNAVRKVQAQALREYRDIIANDINDQ